MNIFEQINQKRLERQEKNKQLRQQREAQQKNKPNAENYQELKKMAEEFYGLLQAEKFPHYVNFLQGLRSDFYSILKSVKGSVEERALKSTELSAMIELLDYILEYPTLIIEKFENYGKTT